jgi:hypothetical protein
MRSRNGVDVAGEIEIDPLQRHQGRLAPARASALQGVNEPGD